MSDKEDLASIKDSKKNGNSKSKEQRKISSPGSGSSKVENRNLARKVSKIIVDVVRYPISQKDPEENKDRGNWANPAEFILSCLRYAVGLGKLSSCRNLKGTWHCFSGNIWRFPYIVYEYGGGTFLFVYWFVFFLVAFPTFLMELTLGQFTSSGPVFIYRSLVPAFEGVGCAAITIQGLGAVYYSALLTYSLFYTLSSMQPTMPWQSCNHEWSSPVICDVPNACALIFSALGLFHDDGVQGLRWRWR